MKRPTAEVREEGAAGVCDVPSVRGGRQHTPAVATP
jgi:hypothetical protein